MFVSLFDGSCPGLSHAMSLGATFTFEYPRPNATRWKVQSIVIGGGSACAEVIASAAAIKITPKATARGIARLMFFIFLFILVFLLFREAI